MSDPTMPRCRDCRWWEPYEERLEDSPMGACLRVKDTEEYIEGERAHLAHQNEDGHVDDPEDAVWLTTRFDFGCVQWEAEPDII